MKISVIVPVYNQEELLPRALNSVVDNLSDYDYEIIVVEDGSTDRTLMVLSTWCAQNVGVDIKIIRNTENQGVGISVNKGYDAAQGEYVVLLGSDDYFLPIISKVAKHLDGTDLVYFNLIDDTGTTWKLTKLTRSEIVGSVKFMRREFLADTRTDGSRVGEDHDLMMKLLDKNPTEKFTNITAKHYTYPRQGSLSDVGWD